MAGSYTRRINLYINGKEVKNDIASIKAEMSKLTNEQARMTRGSREYVEAGKKIRALKGIIQEHNDQLKTVSKSWNFENLSHAMNKYFLAVSTFVAGFSGLLYSGKKAITMFAEFDDKVSDVRKTTGLTREQVVAMNEELKKVDTRTAQLELLDLGRIAGKLGINAEKDVEGFIRASDKVVVALKEDLGDNAEEAVRQIGKLVTVFGVRDEFGIEESITKTGSALNELGMASTANEAYIVQFTKRVAGVAPTAKISIQDVMGLAATLDHLGQTSEVSSTAYSQVITGMFKDTAAFARAARMDVKDFSDLLKKDANEAFIKLLEGLNNNDAGMEELIKSMGDLDMEGKRAISVIGVLSNNVKILREQQAISNREFEKGTSLEEEFNVKNNNAQAILEKKRKVLNNLAIELGEKLMPALTVSTSGFSYFVKAGIVMTDFFIKHSGAIVKVTASIAAYTIATKLATMWQARQSKETLRQIIATNINNVATGVAKGVTLLYAAAQAVLTGNTNRASAAMRLFNASVKANPIGLFVGVFTLAAGALLTYAKRTREATAEKQALNNVSRKTNELMDDQASKIKFLVERIESENVSNNLRKQAIEELKRIMPGYNAELTEEGRLINHNTQAIKDYLVMLEMKFRKQAAEEEMIELIKKESAAQRELQKAENEYQSAMAQNPLNEVVGGGEAGVAAQAARSGIVNRAKNRRDRAEKEHQQTVKALETMRGEVEKAVQAYEKSLEGSPAGLNNGENLDPDNRPPVPPAPDNKNKKWSLNSDINFLRESLKLKQDYNEGVIATEQELQRRLRALEIEYLKNRILSGKESGEDLLALQQTLADKIIEIRKEEEKRSGELTEASLKGQSAIDREKQEHEVRLIELKLFGKSREEMTALELAALESLEKQHHQKLAKLDADAMKDEIERIQQEYETIMATMRLRNADELNSITSLAQAKEILSEFMSNEELQKIRSLDKAKRILRRQQSIEEEQFTREHLQKLLETLQQVMGSGDWEGLNLSDTLLSEEERQVLVERINEVKKLLSGLTAGSEETDPKAGRIGGMSTDILGFTPEDWELLFQNLKDGKGGIGELIMGVKALGMVWQAYYDNVSAGEQARLTEFERSVNKQKDQLQEHLDNNLISQESYNYQVSKLDEDLDRKKAEFEYRNAVRSRNVALMNAIVNTATAITSALTVAPPLGIILASIVGAMGGLQVGAILKTPLPELPGRETGGYLDVQRQQDGKRFRAKHDPRKRGYVSTPTIIAGEKRGSSEYIVSDAGVNNPTIRPILDILEMGRLNGNLSTINLPAILESTRTYPGRQQGGYISDMSGNNPSSNQPAAAPAQDPALLEIIRQNTIVMAALKTRLEKPIKSTVALHGRGGFYETMEEDTRLKNNANL
ncbi:Phage-related minor tail protein [anaerobic digester metagenome]